MPPYGIVQSRFLLRLPASTVAGTSTPVRIEVTQAGQLVEMVETSFLAIPITAVMTHSMKFHWGVAVAVFYTAFALEHRRVRRLRDAHATSNW